MMNEKENTEEALLYVAEESEKINNIIGTSIPRDEN
jgi:hypothetical protein